MTNNSMRMNSIQHHFIYNRIVLLLVTGLLLFLCSVFLSCFYQPAARSAEARSDLPVPTILDVQLYSHNLCDPGLAIDNDRITCEFTLAEPYRFPKESPGGRFCTSLDLLHFRFTFRIANGLLPDQTCLTPVMLFDWLFMGNYRYYGDATGVVYFAPLDLSYQIAEGEAAITITANHSLVFLPPEQITTDTGSLWSISVIDDAGNGPCCITVPLESPDTLLYNLTSSEPLHYLIDLYQP